MSSILEKVVVLGAVAAGVGTLGYIGADGKIAESIGGIEALPEAVRSGLKSSFEYVSGNINWVGDTVSKTVHMDALIADERLRSAITAGITLFGATALASLGLSALSGNESSGPGGVPAGPGSPRNV